MNIFRDLVEELKEENLLEETVIDPVSDEEDPVDQVSDNVAEPAVDLQEEQADLDEGDAAADPFDQAETNEPNSGSADEAKSEGISTDDETVDGLKNADRASESEAVENSMEFSFQESLPDAFDSDELSGELATEADGKVASSDVQEKEDSKVVEDDPPKASLKARSPEEERQFYRQRAMDEVTGLQLVEHVMSGVEREQKKSAPKSFDDLAVKRSLHDFLKVADNLNTPEHAQAEFQLMQETENWASALSRRDRNISVAHLRRYCETTKPSLSSQAMISLARFYRNSPYSESVRSKFDLVFTKLFSKDVGDEKRAVVFEHEELVKHIQELYADWSSVPLYSTDDDDPELLLAALKFQEFIDEAKQAESFDELVRKDFFKRLKVFKEKSNENFFAPALISAAIESNVAVGNRYIELIELERASTESKDIGDKYGFVHDDSVSEATSKTLQLLEIIQNEKQRSQPEPNQPVEAKIAAAPKVKDKVAKTDEEEASGFTLIGNVNKWLIVVAVVLVMVTAWQFLQGPTVSGPQESRANGKAVEFVLSGTVINKHVHSARISKNTLYGITRESWSGLSVEEKREFISKSVAVGEENKKFRKVHLLNLKGESVAYGSNARVKVY